MKMKAVLVRWLAVCVIGCSMAGAQTTIMNDHFNNSSNTNNATGWQVQVSGASITTPSNGLSTNSYLSSSLVNYQTMPRVPIYPDYGALLLTLGQGSPQVGGTRAFVSPAYPVPSGTTRVTATVSVHPTNVAPEDV